jgi:hypothetical protein
VPRSHALCSRYACGYKQSRTATPTRTHPRTRLESREVLLRLGPIFVCENSARLPVHHAATSSRIDCPCNERLTDFIPVMKIVLLGPLSTTHNDIALKRTRVVTSVGRFHVLRLIKIRNINGPYILVMLHYVL